MSYLPFIKKMMDWIPSCVFGTFFIWISSWLLKIWPRSCYCPSRSCSNFSSDIWTAVETNGSDTDSCATMYFMFWLFAIFVSRWERVLVIWLCSWTRPAVPKYFITLVVLAPDIKPTILVCGSVVISTFIYALLSGCSALGCAALTSIFPHSWSIFSPIIRIEI